MRAGNCEQCGAEAPLATPCPVCDHLVGDPVTSALREHGETEGALPRAPLARWWHTGQLGVFLAAALSTVGLFLPLAGGLRLQRQGQDDAGEVWVSLFDYVTGRYPSLHGQMTAFLLPGAVLFLAQLLRSRRTGGAMLAARPLVTVVALAPLVSVVMPLLRLRRLGVDVRVGPAPLVVLAAVTVGVMAGLRFGRDVPEAPPKPRFDRL
ncbi:MAG: hypothetical protein JNK72_15000 [Myxococcales bacterium]|nr:hypothetical protein [Myxococcales bacterium]